MTRVASESDAILVDKCLAPAHVVGHRLSSTSSLVSLLSTSETVVGGTCLPSVRISFVPESGHLGEVRGECVKRGQAKEFLDACLKDRCKQLYPRDLPCVEVPTKRGGYRPVGMLRRTLRFHKELRCSQVVIDFIYVLKSHRGMGLGRKLLERGMVAGKKAKPCTLLVAGSEDNVTAVKLYESMGFTWSSSLFVDMFAPASAAQALMDRAPPPTAAPEGATEAEDACGMEAGPAPAGTAESIAAHIAG